MGLFNRSDKGSLTVLFVRESKARGKKFAIAAGVLVVIAAGGGYGLSRHMTARAEERVEASWTALHHCLLGEALAKDEQPSVRFRAVQLGGMTLADVHRAQSNNNPWPERCSQHAYELRESLVAASKAEEGQKDLGYWAEKLATALRDGALAADLSEPIDAAWQQASKLGLKLGEPSADAPKAPAPMTGLNVDVLDSKHALAKGAIDLRAMQTELDSGTVLHVVVEDKQGPDPVLLCSATAANEPMKCVAPAVEIPASELGLRLLGSSQEGAEPLVFVGNRGTEGVYRAVSGDKLGAGLSLGGYAAPTFASLLTWDEAGKRLTLVRKSESAAPKSQPLATDKVQPSDPTRDVRLLWNHVFVRGTNAFKETWLAAAEVKEGPSATGPMTDVGLLSEPGTTRREGDGPAITGCQGAKTTAVRVRGDTSEFVSFLVGGKWTKPVKVEGVGGTLTCRRSEAWITRVEQGQGEGLLQSSIKQVRCTPAACRSDSIKISEVLTGEMGLAPVVEVAAAQLGGKLLLVWRGGERGGVRMRLGALRTIAQEPDVLLFDDLIKGGRVQSNSTLSDLRLLTHEDFGLLVLSTSAGTYALSIDGEGKYSQVKIER